MSAAGGTVGRMTVHERPFGRYLEDFTPVLRQEQPEAAVRRLNANFEVIVPELLSRDGVVDKFVGAIGSDQIRELFETHSAGITVEAGAPAEAGAPPAAAQPIQPMKKDWLPPGMERR